MTAPPRFDLAAARDLFTKAGITWAQTQFGLLLTLSETTTAAAEQAWLDMQHAGAIYAWEVGRAARQHPTTSALYDEDTTAALLRGVQG